MIGLICVVLPVNKNFVLKFLSVRVLGTRDLRYIAPIRSTFSVISVNLQRVHFLPHFREFLSFSTYYYLPRMFCHFCISGSTICGAPPVPWTRSLPSSFSVVFLQSGAYATHLLTSSNSGIKCINLRRDIKVSA